ncbi:hypothetical protein ACFQHV_16365 [Promicromonospora thailandica]|uniref:ABC-2 family transporter protein n=1 Tax=Promicromonospora thailandica TaxID=765201 RepID=A0A9X2JY62_9MICO|nr:hypothetical protein [Promicromonospora thailandica]MCP2267347.1 ABC-2 family transporter protein [Promicromonospora thailandica]BFF20789.1 hypothetical protein GCM10025730_43100 [Promicromonospora thailandica]
MTGLVWSELVRFAGRAAIGWVAAAMLLHVVLVVALLAAGVDLPTPAVVVGPGTVPVQALGSVALALMAGVLLVTGDAAQGGTRAVLTVEPRRGRVYWSKVAAAGIAVVPGVAVAYALLVSGTYAVGARAEGLGAPSAEIVRELSWGGARTVGLALCAAAAGAALGLLARRWWAVLALVTGGVVADRAAAAAARGTAELPSAWSGLGPALLALPPAQATLALLGSTAAVTLLGAVVFRRRDVP